MKKIFLYPLWNGERLEKFLKRMEADGFRLCAVSWYFLFEFNKTIPQSVQYFFSYSFLKENEMRLWEHELRHDYGADIIPIAHSGGVCIHRIADIGADISRFVCFRKNYFKRTILKKFLAVVFLVLGNICCLLNYGNLWPIFSLGMSLCLIALIYYVCGLFVVCKTGDSSLSSEIPQNDEP